MKESEVQSKAVGIEEVKAWGNLACANRFKG